MTGHSVIRDLMCSIGLHEWVDTDWHLLGVVITYQSCRNCDRPKDIDGLAAAYGDFIEQRSNPPKPKEEASS